MLYLRLSNPDFVAPNQSGLWRYESAEGIAARPMNSVCMAGLGRWEDIRLWEDWICSYPFVFAASTNRAFIDKVRQYVPWVPVLSPDPAALGERHSEAEMVAAFGPSVLLSLARGERAPPAVLLYP